MQILALTPEQEPKRVPQCTLWLSITYWKKLGSTIFSSVENAFMSLICAPFAPISFTLCAIIWHEKFSLHLTWTHNEVPLLWLSFARLRKCCGLAAAALRSHNTYRGILQSRDLTPSKVTNKCVWKHVKLLSVYFSRSVPCTDFDLFRTF